MRIKVLVSQNRRDFYAHYECEACGFVTESGRGYDDRNFHDNVIPAMKCEKCGKSRNEMGIVEEKTNTRYPEGMQV